MAVITPLGGLLQEGNAHDVNTMKIAVGAAADPAVVAAINACLDAAAAGNGFLLMETVEGGSTIIGAPVISGSLPVAAGATFSVQGGPYTGTDPDIAALFAAQQGPQTLADIIQFSHVTEGELKTEEEIAAAQECFETLFGCPIEDLVPPAEDEKVREFPLDKCVFSRWERIVCYDNSGPSITPGVFHENETDGAQIISWDQGATPTLPQTLVGDPAGSWDQQFAIWGVAADAADGYGLTWQMDYNSVSHYRALCARTTDLTQTFGPMVVEGATGVQHTIQPLEELVLTCYVEVTRCVDDAIITEVLDQNGVVVETPPDFTDGTWSKDCIPPQPASAIEPLGPTDPPPPTLTKDDIAEAIQDGIANLPDTPVSVTYEGEVIGYYETGSGPAWRCTDGDPIPTLGPVVNPAGPGQIGTLFVDPNLPAGVTDFDFTYTVLDAAGGMGTVRAIEKSTGTLLGGSGYPPGAGGAGNSAPLPIEHTITFTVPSGVDSSDVCICFDAFGAAPLGGGWGADEIDPNPSALLTVAPSECLKAAACFEAIFGCTVNEMVAAQNAVDGTTEDPTPADLEPKVKCAVVDALGNVVMGGDDITVTRTTVGVYDVTVADPIIGLSITAEDNAGDDDIQPHYSITGSTVTIEFREQDNGGAGGVLRDSGFSVLVHCAPASGSRLQAESTANRLSASITVDYEASPDEPLCISVLNDTAEDVKVSLSRDPGRDSTFTAKAGAEATTTRAKITSKFYALDEPTEVTVSVGKTVLARGSVEPRKG